VHKVLLIEDDEMVLRMYKKLFTYKGYSLEVARNGELGIKIAKKFKPDLILLDVMLPKMNGLEVLEKLKKDSKLKKIKVVLLTNLGMQDELDKAVENGAVRYIIKNDHVPNEVFKIAEEVIFQKKAKQLPSLKQK
jgi:two-component system, OmpR family, alkaline phosphatase synthesis response regulator PhoP